MVGDDTFAADADGVCLSKNDMDTYVGDFTCQPLICCKLTDPLTNKSIC